MPGDRSSLDKRDFRLLQNMLTTMERQAEALEELNEKLEEQNNNE